MDYRDMHASYLDSLSGARDEELPPPEDEEEEEERAKPYVRINTKTDELFQDLLLLPDEARDLNERLAADGSDYRWMPYGQRKDDLADVVAA